MQAALTPAGAFLLFAGIAVLSTAFSIWIVPESRGRSLEELELELSRLRLCGAAAGDTGGDPAGNGGCSPTASGHHSGGDIPCRLCGGNDDGCCRLCSGGGSGPGGSNDDQLYPDYLIKAGQKRTRAPNSE